MTTTSASEFRRAQGINYNVIVPHLREPYRAITPPGRGICELQHGGCGWWRQDCIRPGPLLVCCINRRTDRWCSTLTSVFLRPELWDTRSAILSNCDRPSTFLAKVWTPCFCCNVLCQDRWLNAAIHSANTEQAGRATQGATIFNI